MSELKSSITVIAGCYNTGVCFLESLNSIKNQTFKNYELIIFDDCSTDNSVILIENWIDKHRNEFSHPILFLRNHTNIGISKNLNKALKLAKGKYFSILGDDTWNKNFLQTLLNIIETTDDNVALVFSDCDVMNYETKTILEDINPIKNINRWYPKKDLLVTPIGTKLYRFNHPFLYDCFYYFSPVIAFTLLVKTDVVKKLGYYNDAYFFEDLPMWLKMFDQYDCIFLDQKLATYNKHQKSISSTITFKYQLALVNIFLAEIKLKKISAKNPIARNKVRNEYSALLNVWKTQKSKYLIEMLKITLKLSVYYPRTNISFLKNRLFQK